MQPLVLRRLLCALALAYGSARCAGSKPSPGVDALVAPGQEKLLQATIRAQDRSAIGDIYVFGDSLSDTGRVHNATFGFYLPKEVYWHGRASNGPVWIDYVSSALNSRAHNYAMAGAATGAQRFPVSLIVNSLDDQVDMFIAEVDAKTPSLAQAVAVIWIGPNNYLGADVTSAETAAAAIRVAATRLFRHGVQRLAIGSMPDLAGVLKAPDSGRKSDATLRQLTDKHNAAVKDMMTELRASFPSQQITLFNAYRTNQGSVQTPSVYGFTRLDVACYQGDYRGHFFGEERFCANPLGVKLWDYLHPNSRMHCHYAVGFLSDIREAGWLAAFQAKEGSQLCRNMPGG